MHEALAVADRRDEALIAVLGPPTFYRRFGFGPAEEAGCALSVRRSRRRVPGAPDRRACRSDPGSIVYPPMFEAGSRS